MKKHRDRVAVCYNTEIELLSDIICFLRSRLNMYPKKIQDELIKLDKMVVDYYGQYSSLGIKDDINDEIFYLISENETKKKINYRYMEEKNLSLLIDGYLSKVSYNDNIEKIIKDLENELINNEEKNKKELGINDNDEDTSYYYLKETVFDDSLLNKEL